MDNLMKYGIVGLIIISLFSCDNDDKMDEEQLIVGTWQLVEVYASPGGPGSWYPVKNGYKYTFFSDGNFSSDRFDECMTGTYMVESNLLTLNYDCDGFTKGIESPQGVFVEKINFETPLIQKLSTREKLHN